MGILDQIGMAGVLDLVLPAIAPEGVFRSDFPWSKRTRLAPADPFAMPALSTPFRRE